MTKKNQLFLHLLEQIKFPNTFEDNSILQQGEVEDVDVFATEKKWQIHVFLTTPLQFNTYHSFIEALKASFADIVDVELDIRTQDGASTFLPEYWNYVVENSKLLPMQKQVLSKETPTLKENKY